MTASRSESETAQKTARILSIDALRGIVMFTMIFVNDLAGVSPTLIPWWMRHFKADGNGMTIVDLVFPAFLFLVGMSIPSALDLLGLSSGYGRIGELGLGAAIARSASCALLILAFSVQLNRSGFRLRL